MAEQDLKYVIKVIRAILVSAPSDGLLTRQLLNDYQNIEGCSLPFRKLGFDSLDDLIQKCDEFMQKRSYDGIKIVLNLKELKDSAHMHRLVQQQTRSKSRKKKPTMPQRPIHSPTANNQQQRWRGSAYTDMYSRMPNRSVKKAVATPAPATIPSLMSLRIDPPPVRSNRQYGQTTEQQTQNANGSTGNQSMETPAVTSTPCARKNVNQDMRPITKQSNIIDNGKFSYNSNKIDPPAPPTNTVTHCNGQAGNRILNRINANQNNNQQQSTAQRAMAIGPVSPNGSVNIPRTKINLSDRLASKKPLVNQMADVSLDADVVDFVNAQATINLQEVTNVVSIRTYVSYVKSQNTSSSHHSEMFCFV